LGPAERAVVVRLGVLATLEVLLVLSTTFVLGYIDAEWPIVAVTFAAVWIVSSVVSSIGRRRLSLPARPILALGRASLIASLAVLVISEFSAPWFFFAVGLAVAGAICFRVSAKADERALLESATRSAHRGERTAQSTQNQNARS